MHRATLVLIALTASLLVTPDAGAARMCLGKQATMVGTNRADRVRGTPRADVIVTLGGSDTIDGRGGNDRICAGGGSDGIIGGPGHDRIEAAAGFDLVLAGAGDDSIDLGGGFFNFVEGGSGDDRMTGRSLLDLAIYDRAPRAIEVDLAAGSATGHGADTLTRIEGIIGSSFDDTITGDDRSNLLAGHEGHDTISSGGNAGNLDSPGSGGADVLQGDSGPDPALQIGDDTLIGGSGLNIALYAGSLAGVDVDLLLGTANGEGNDELTDIQAVIGSPLDDNLSGDLNANAFEGSGGNDVIDGRAGQDVAMFTAATEVTADLATGTATPIYTDAPGTVTMTDIEDLWGSAGPDTLSGNLLANRLFGGAGADTITAAAGDDHLDGEAGNRDNLDGGDGSDTCLNGETVLNCEALRHAPLRSHDAPDFLRLLKVAWRTWVSSYART